MSRILPFSFWLFDGSVRGLAWPAGWAGSGRFPRDDLIYRMRVMDAAGMFIIDGIALLKLDLPVCIVREKLPLAKKAEAERFQIRRGRKPVNKDGYYIVSAGGGVRLYAMQD